MDCGDGFTGVQARVEMRSEMRSPAWTTNISEVPPVRN
ncbi:MAG: DUF4113 domain-containing protein [Oxalobacteraceae bacterium]|nr:MAG: DUF4113 domain-containing protein [Oxalobacteraceae bacterium]